MVAFSTEKEEGIFSQVFPPIIVFLIENQEKSCWCHRKYNKTAISPIFS